MPLVSMGRRYGGAGSPVTFDAVGGSLGFVVNPSSPVDYGDMNVIAGTALVAFVSYVDKTITGTGVVWDAGGTPQNMTLLGAVNAPGASGGRVELWGLINPHLGNNILRVSFTGGTTIITLQAVSFIGGHSFGTFASDTASSTNSFSVNVPSNLNHMIVGAAVAAQVASMSSISGTEIYRFSSVTGEGACYDAGASPTQTVAITMTGPDNIGICGIDVAP